MPAEESQVIASHADQQHDLRHADALRQSQQDSIAANTELCGLPWWHQETVRSSVQESDHVFAAASDIFEPARDNAHTASSTGWPDVCSGPEAGGAGQAQVTSSTGHGVLVVTRPAVVLQSESPSVALTAAPVMAHLTAVQAAVPGHAGRPRSAVCGSKATVKAVARHSKTGSKVGKQLGSRKVDLPGSQAARDTSRLQHVMASASAKHVEVPKGLGVMPSDTPVRREVRAAARSSDKHVMLSQMHAASPRSDAVPVSMRDGRNLQAAAVSPRAAAMSPRAAAVSPRIAAVSPKAAATPPRATFTFPRPTAVSPRAAAAAPKAAVPRAAAASPRASLTDRAMSARPHSASPKAAAKRRPAFVSATRSGCIVASSRPLSHQPHSGHRLASTASATETVRTQLADNWSSSEHQAPAAQVDYQALVPQATTHHVPRSHISHDASSAGRVEMAEPSQDQQSHSSAYHCPQTFADCSQKASEISQAAADHLHAAVHHRYMATDHRVVATGHRHMAVDHGHIGTDMAVDHSYGATDHRHMAVHHCHVGTDHRRPDVSGQLGRADEQQLGHPLLLDSIRPVQASAPASTARDSQSDCESSSRSTESDFDCGQSLSSQLESESGDRRRQVSSARDDFAQQPDSVGSIAQLFMMRQRAKVVFQVSVQRPDSCLFNNFVSSFLSCSQQLSKHALCQQTTFQTSCSGETRLVLHVPSSS